MVRSCEGVQLFWCDSHARDFMVPVLIFKEDLPVFDKNRERSTFFIFLPLHFTCIV